MAEQEFLILSVKHSPGHGGTALWWGPGQRGYYAEIEGAGRYGEAEAKRICAQSHGGSVMMTVEAVMGHAVTVVDYPKVRPQTYLEDRG